MAFLFEKAKRIVLKLGTGILTSGVGQLDTEKIAAVGREVAALRRKGFEVIIVSSGAVGLGMGRLGLEARPAKLSSLQKCAAVGQSILIQTWQKAFDPHGMIVAQLLLTADDVRVRQRHLAVKELLEELLAEAIIPVINENDSVSAEGIKFGDNDTLSALVASLTKSDMLVILSTAPGLIDMKGTGKILPVVEKITPEIEAMAGGTTSPTAVGGMVSKIKAAKVAGQSGCGVFIASGEDPATLQRLVAGEPTGTFFVPSRMPLGARKRWIAFFHMPRGVVTVDAGAERALREDGSSLLARGVTGCKGPFGAGDVVTIQNAQGVAFARGIMRFDDRSLAAIAGKSTAEIKPLFPNMKRFEVIHRDALVLLA